MKIERQISSGAFDVLQSIKNVRSMSKGSTHFNIVMAVHRSAVALAAGTVLGIVFSSLLHAAMTRTVSTSGGVQGQAGGPVAVASVTQAAPAANSGSTPILCDCSHCPPAPVPLPLVPTVVQPQPQARSMTAATVPVPQHAPSGSAAKAAADTNPFGQLYDAAAAAPMTGPDACTRIRYVWGSQALLLDVCNKRPFVLLAPEPHLMTLARELGNDHCLPTTTCTAFTMYRVAAMCLMH